MAAIAPVATLIGTGVSLYAANRQSQQQSAQNKLQVQQAQYDSTQRQTQLAAQAASDARQRQETLDRTTASVRARLGAAGVSPDTGSAAAITGGMAQTAAAAQSDNNTLFQARLAAGRQSLLNTDGSLTAWLRAGQGFGGVARSLLD